MINNLESKQWTLESLLEQLPTIARKSRDRWPHHCTFFEAAVEALRTAPFPPPSQLLQELMIESATATDAASGRSPVDPGSPEWSRRHWPTPQMPTDDRSAQLFCVQQATWAALRSMARSGFFAIAGLQVESLGCHRRTREALVHLELLVDDITLARPYWDHARETTREKRTANAFFKATERANSQIGNPQFPRSKHTALRRALADRASFGLLNAGPHAGALHGVSGFAAGAYGFFDTISENGPRYAFVFAYETLQLTNLLMPKLSWIEQPAWAQSFACFRKAAQEIEREDRNSDRMESVPLPPWSSFVDAPLP